MNASQVNPNSEDHPLQGPDTGRKVIRGSAIRAAGYVFGMLLTAVASIFLLRHLGVVNFGRFVTVTSIISIVTALADAGLTAIGQREYVLCKSDGERKHLLSCLVGIRLVVAPIGALIAIAFTLVAGYPSVMVAGAALAGAGMIVYMVQATLVLQLSADLRVAELTVAEVVRQFVIVVCFGILVFAGATLLPFLAVSIPAAAAALVVTIVFVRDRVELKPSFDRKRWRILIVESIPVAAALAVNVVYFRVLIVMLSLMVSAVQTGLFATSFRMLEILVNVPVLLLGVALPVLSHANHYDQQRLRYVMQRMSEVSLIIACYLILLVLITAELLINTLGGAQYDAAAPILRIQVLALLGAFLGQVWQLGLVSIHRQSALVVSNVVALATVIVLGLVLIPRFGASGAAVVAAIGESVLASVTLILLVKARRELTPNFSFAWKPLLAAGLAALPFLLLELPTLVVALLSTVIYCTVVLLAKALPPETIQALLRKGEPTL